MNYLMKLLPKIAKRTASNPEAYVYLAESIRAWPGFYRVGIHQRRDSMGNPSLYVFSVRLFGDLSAATTARMTTHVYLGNDVASLTATWAGKPGRWRLSQAAADAAVP